MGKFLNLMVITVAAIMVGCTGNGTTQNGSQQNDSAFREAAMSIYAYHPERHFTSSTPQSPWGP